MNTGNWSHTNDIKWSFSFLPTFLDSPRDIRVSQKKLLLTLHLPQKKSGLELNSLDLRNPFQYLDYLIHFYYVNNEQTCSPQSLEWSVMAAKISLGTLYRGRLGTLGSTNRKPRNYGTDWLSRVYRNQPQCTVPCRPRYTEPRPTWYSVPQPISAAKTDHSYDWYPIQWENAQDRA